MDTPKAVAIGYSEEKGIPEILAKAKGFLVDNLIMVAKENNIAIYKDADLAGILMTVDNKEIPEDMFRAVAEVLAFCYRVNDKFREKLNNTGLLR